MKFLIKSLVKPLALLFNKYIDEGRCPLALYREGDHSVLDNSTPIPMSVEESSLISDYFL